VVLSSVRCRVHLADDVRREGENIPFEDPELAGMMAAAIQIVRTALAGLRPDLLEYSEPRSKIDMNVLLDPDARWTLAQIALDFLGTHLADTRPFCWMMLSPPTRFESELLSKMVLHLQVAVPAAAQQELLPRLELALKAVVREAAGADVSAFFAVEPADGAEEVGERA
jgi:hypothetical protein